MVDSCPEEVGVVDKRDSELEEISKDFNNLFELDLEIFNITYEGMNPEEMPDEDSSKGPYLDYMYMEELYSKCNPPTPLNAMKMRTLRANMQRYAETHR